MRWNLRRVAMAGFVAAAGTSVIGVSAARACDHGAAAGYGPAPAPRWGYGLEVNTSARFGGLPDYDRCSVCHPRLFVPPPCPAPPPPCDDEFEAVAAYRRVSYRAYSRQELPVTYPSPAAPYASPQETASYGSPYYPTPPLPAKQAPAIYGTPQYQDQAPIPAPLYSAPQARRLYPPQAPAIQDDLAPPLPSPNLGPLQ